MDVYLLYLCIKKLISDINLDYSVSFNDMDSNGKDVVGVFIKGSTPSRYRALSNGVYINKTARVQVLGQAKDTYDSLIEMLCFFTRLEDMVSELGGVIYNTQSLQDTELLSKFEDYKNIEDVIVLRTDTITSSSYIGKTEQGLPMFDINFEIEYGVTSGDVAKYKSLIDEQSDSMIDLLEDDECTVSDDECIVSDDVSDVDDVSATSKDDNIQLADGIELVDFFDNNLKNDEVPVVVDEI